MAPRGLVFRRAAALHCTDVPELPADNLRRYARQVAFEPLGRNGQRALGQARALIVGVGGLGSWAAELLARAGVAALRLVDADRVEPANLHRQALYDEADAAEGRPKVAAAARRLGQINAGVAVEAVQARLDAANVARLADGADVILDGTDNFQTRFVINDYAVMTGRPWVFAGVVGAEGQVMAVVPNRTGCLRCLYDGPPPADPPAPPPGVFGPAVAAIAAIEAVEAIKILAGRPEAVSGQLTKLDLWRNTVQRIAVGPDANCDCKCCKKSKFEYLQP